VVGKFGPSEKKTAGLFRGKSDLRTKWARVHISFCDDDKEISSLAKESGCRFPFLRTEYIFCDACGQDADSVEKVKVYGRAFRFIKKHGITAMSDFNFGFDFDDASVFERSLDLTLANPIDLVRLNIVIP